MEAAVKKKGTVTPISALFSPEETQKASERVQERIADRRKQLDILEGFTSENTGLINLVQTLPNELQHQIMVPWGKAAFFPGQLIHTNEFMVLLGDGYYAERTSKQTVEILNRRQKVLESQVESAKTDIQDLKTEAYFFNATADEAASGVVQIVEDYTGERPFHEGSNSGEFPGSSEAVQERTGNEDDEYERIFSRLAELEMEEEAAENGNENEQSDDGFDHNANQSGSEDDEYERIFSRLAELEEEEAAENGNENEQSDDGFDHNANQSGNEDVEYERIFSRLAELEKEEEAAENSNENEQSDDDFDHNANQFSGDEVVRPLGVNGSKQLSPFQDVTSPARAPASNISSLTENALQLPEIKQNVQAPAVAKHEASVPPLQPGASSSKAFTGSIVEHTHNLETKPREESVAGRSKPVSRFKMNRK